MVTDVPARLVSTNPSMQRTVFAWRELKCVQSNEKEGSCLIKQIT